MVILGVFGELLLSFLIGFMVGIITVYLHNRISYHSKGVKQYGYSSREQNKKLISDSSLLKPTKEEHATNDFK